VTTFAIINEVEITELARLKASGASILTYTALLTFSRNKASCFPNLETIRNYLGNHYNLRTIQKALKWLSDNKLIKRNEKTSKKRFVLLKRLISHTPDRSRQYAQSGTIKKDRKKTSFLRDELKKYKEIVHSFSRNKKKNQPSKQELERREAQRQAELKKQESAEFALHQLLSGLVTVNQLTTKQREALHQAILQRTLDVDYEWLDEYHPGRLENIKQKISNE
jgi:hypothetical protein